MPKDALQVPIDTRCGRRLSFMMGYLWMVLVVLLGDVIHGYGGYQGDRCPVMAPCFCDNGGPRGQRIKRIVCGQVEASSFPQFIENGETVECVTLMYTGLTHIPSDAFSTLQHIQVLDLQGNNFGERIDARAFAGVAPYVRAMNLAWSNITAINDKVFRGMMELRNLTLAENKITRLQHSVFQDLRNLRRLSLAGNTLRHLPPTLFRFQTNLEVLDLGYCSIQALPAYMFAGMWNLKKLDLRGNEVKILLPGLFEDLWSLNALLLSHNPIRRLRGGVFRGLSSLERLELKESSLESIERDVFADTIRLHTLDLGDNKLVKLDPGVLSVHSLEFLYLDGNHLHRLPKDISRMTNLVYLDISYNEISKMDRCLFERLRNLQYLNVRQNPFRCNCDLFWLRTLQMRLLGTWKNTQMIPFVPAECWEPASLRGVGITNWLELDCLKITLYPCQYTFWSV